MDRATLTDKDMKWVSECMRIQKYLLLLGLILTIFLGFYLFTYVKTTDMIIKSVCENNILLQAIIVFFVMGIWYLNHKFLGIINVLMCKNVSE